MYKSALCITLCLCLMTVACGPLEQSARNGIATAKGFLDQEKVAHPECAGATPSVSPVCTLIHKGVAAKDVTIDALEQYCSGPEFDAGTGPCSPNAALSDKLKAALRDLNAIIGDIKKAGA